MEGTNHQPGLMQFDVVLRLLRFRAIAARMIDRRPALMSLLLGAGAALGFAPLNWWPVTLGCLAAWMALIWQTHSARAALWRGWLFGIAHFTAANIWIQTAFTYQEAMPAALGYPAVVLLAGYLAAYPAIAAGAAWWLAVRQSTGFGRRAPDGSFVLVVAASWIACEWLRATLLTGYPWDPVAAVWLPLIGVARSAAWIGTYALSGLTMLVAGAFLLLTHRQWRLAAPVLAIVAVMTLSSVIVPQRRTAPDPAAPRLRVIQPNLDQEQRPRDDYAEANLAAIEAQMGTPGAAPRLIIWPEGALRFFIEQGYPPEWYTRGQPDAVLARIAARLGPADIVLTGGNGLQFDAQGKLATATNSVFAIDAGGRLLGRYDKAHLVPWGEYLPARPIMSALGLSRLVPGNTDFKPGPGPAALRLPGFGDIGFAICYEIIFSGHVVDRAHRPALIVNPSNDSWYGPSGPLQHLAMARLRAIEEGLPVVRATPTGVSAIIAADGTELATVGAATAGAIELPLPPPGPPTLFARIGNLLAAIVAALLLVLAFAIRPRAR
ncbi:MAG: apolipoprotein N-acyltransferase [Sphingomonas sp.]